MLTAAPNSASFSVGPLTFPNGSAPLTAKVDLTGTTQFGNTNAINALKQDGYTSGQLTAFAINPDGTITGKFSNEQSKLLGQVVLSSFANPNGLEPKGQNMYAETQASGQALTGTPGIVFRTGDGTVVARSGLNERELPLILGPR
jgi:flagellar hook protein FlgE